MEDMEFDHLVADMIQFQVSYVEWALLGSRCIEDQALKYLTDIGIEVERVERTAVIRLPGHVLVRLE